MRVRSLAVCIIVKQSKMEKRRSQWRLSSSLLTSLAPCECELSAEYAGDTLTAWAIPPGSCLGGSPCDDLLWCTQPLRNVTNDLFWGLLFSKPLNLWIQMKVGQEVGVDQRHGVMVLTEPITGQSNEHLEEQLVGSVFNPVTAKAQNYDCKWYCAVSDGVMTGDTVKSKR